LKEEEHKPKRWNKLDAKGRIEKYELWKTQLVFSLFRFDRKLKKLVAVTDVSPVHSQVMNTRINQAKGNYMRTKPMRLFCLRHLCFFSDKDAAVSIVTTNDDNTEIVACKPDKGDWKGGNTVRMTFNKLSESQSIFYPLTLLFNICPI
jgi:hypothetical protein